MFASSCEWGSEDDHCHIDQRPRICYVSLDSWWQEEDIFLLYKPDELAMPRNKVSSTSSTNMGEAPALLTEYLVVLYLWVTFGKQKAYTSHLREIKEGGNTEVPLRKTASVSTAPFKHEVEFIKAFCNSSSWFIPLVPVLGLGWICCELPATQE